MSSPSLVGGFSLRAYDLPGATVFAVAYGLLIPGLVYRLFDKRWRSIVMIQTVLFTIERPILFSLRASAAARNTESSALTKYFQAAFALGYLGLAQMVLNLVRTVVVNATNGTPASSSEPSSDDDPRRRFWYRRWADFLAVIHLVATVFGILATVRISAANESGPNHAHQVERYASCGLGLMLILSETFTLLWASWTLPRIDRRAVRFLLVLTTLITIPTIYRLVVMRHTTPDVAARTPQALNTGADKAVFYVVHLVPEWTVMFLLCAFNAKDICQMKFEGDHMWDETEREREVRERRERKRAAKKSGLQLESRTNDGSVSTSV
ncbi:hypothetical protein K438DRAFT_1804235 [Mycena galopus ATCC 62051]|nr:hypothetical protein K438DRAFT_1804235 [Mycena galopus ATCC 62051]